MRTPKEISALLARDAEGVCRHLLPGGRRQGSEWKVGSIQGEKGESLGVHLTGDRAGVWCDFATGESGDMLDLWCACRGLGIGPALQEAKGYLGVTDPQFSGHKPKSYKRPGRPTQVRVVRDKSPVMEFLHSRGLTDETITAFKVVEQAGQVKFPKLEDNAGTIVFPYLRDGELIFTKYLALSRPGGKKQVMVEAGCEPCLFGWQAVPDDSRMVVITEGEIDCMTVLQMGFPALSVPFGGGGGDKQRWIETEFHRLDRFDTIYVCMDQDPEGDAAAMEIIERLGRHRCRLVKLPHKDANACLLRGMDMQEFGHHIMSAMTLDPEELRSASEFVDDVIREFYPEDGVVQGLRLPWSKNQDRLLFRPAEVTIWTGINGHGKSLMQSHLMAHGMRWGERVCIASMEMPPRRTLHRMTKQLTGQAEPSVPFIRHAHQWMGDRLWLFAVVGRSKGERIIEVFRYARQRYRITQFVVDSLAKCGIAEDDYNGQKGFVEKLVDFAHEYECHVHLVAHARKGQDESRPPGKMDVKGTGGITDMVDNVVCVWRNKPKEDAREKANLADLPLDPEVADRPDALLICDKQRNGDWEGTIGLWFDVASQQYLGQRVHTPRPMIEFSITTDPGGIEI